MERRLFFSKLFSILTWAGLTVLFAYGLAFMYVAIIGTYTEKSEFNNIVGSSMLDEFYIALGIVFVLRIILRILKSHK